MARRICAPLTGTDPGSGKVESRRLGGAAADHPDGVVPCPGRRWRLPVQIRQLVASPGAGGVPGSALVKILADGTRVAYTFQFGSIRSGSNGARDPCG
jgi:hypothetical protein